MAMASLCPQAMKRFTNYKFFSRDADKLVVIVSYRTATAGARQPAGARQQTSAGSVASARVVSLAATVSSAVLRMDMLTLPTALGWYMWTMF